MTQILTVWWWNFLHAVTSVPAVLYPHLSAHGGSVWSWTAWISDKKSDSPSLCLYSLVVQLFPFHPEVLQVQEAPVQTQVLDVSYFKTFPNFSRKCRINKLLTGGPSGPTPYKETYRHMVWSEKSICWCSYCRSDSVLGELLTAAPRGPGFPGSPWRMKKYMHTYWNTVVLVKVSCVSQQTLCVHIPPAHHMTAPGTLDPAMFSLMRIDVGASFPTEITQKTCRIKSHLSQGIGLCTAALAAMPKDWTAAWHHFTDSLWSRKSKGSLVTHFLPRGTAGPRISNRASQTLQRRDIRLN